MPTSLNHVWFVMPMSLNSESYLVCDAGVTVFIMRIHLNKHLNLIAHELGAEVRRWMRRYYSSFVVWAVKYILPCWIKHGWRWDRRSPEDRNQFFYDTAVCCMAHFSILIKHECCVSVCLSICAVFLSHQKSQLHEILAQGVIWANLKHDEARFSKFWFLRILWPFFVFFKMRFLVFFRVFFRKSQPF